MNPVYDLKELACSNLHIHSVYSRCAKPEMHIESIVAEAQRSGLRRIAVTDHFNSEDCPILEQNAAMREKIAKKTQGLEVLFVAELSAYGVGKVLESDEVHKTLDYRLYTYNHFHLDYWEHPEDKSPRGYVAHSLAVLTGLFRSKRADCIAHPFIGRFIRCFEDRQLVTKEITDHELGDIMELGRRSGCAWELNTGAILGDPAFGRRYWNIGREAGVTFHMATDAHRLHQIDTAQYIETLEGILD